MGYTLYIGSLPHKKRICDDHRNVASADALNQLLLKEYEYPTKIVVNADVGVGAE